MKEINEEQLIKELQTGFSDKKSSATASFVYQSPSSVKEYISTGSYVLDTILSNKSDGGVPVGRYTEICGDEGAGKTLLASYIMANTQKKGGIAIMIDSERAVSQEVLQSVGVDLKKLIHVQADSVEDVFRAMESIIETVRKSDAKDKLITIVWDSVAATATLAEIEGDYGDHTIGLKARKIGQALRKLTPIISDYRVCVVFINQLRTKVGITFGDPDVTPGGKAIPFHASIRMKLTNIQQLKDNDTKIVVGKVIKCKITKNKIGPSTGRELLYQIRWGDRPGAYIDDSAFVFDLLESSGIIKKITSQRFSLTIPGLKEPIEFKKKMWEELLKDKEISSNIKRALEKKLIITEESFSEDSIVTENVEGADG